MTISVRGWGPIVRSSLLALAIVLLVAGVFFDVLSLTVASLVVSASTLAAMQFGWLPGSRGKD